MQCFPITSHHTRLPFLHFLNVYSLLLTHKIEHCLWHLLYLHLLDLMLSQLLYSVPQGPDPLPFRVLSAAETEEHQSLIQTNSIKVITHYNTSLFTFCLILFYVFLLVYNLFGIKQGPERLPLFKIPDHILLEMSQNPDLLLGRAVSRMEILFHIGLRDVQPQKTGQWLSDPGNVSGKMKPFHLTVPLWRFQSLTWFKVIMDSNKFPSCPWRKKNAFKCFSWNCFLCNLMKESFGELALDIFQLPHWFLPHIILRKVTQFHSS